VLAPLMVDDGMFGILVTARHRADSFSGTDREFLLQLSEHVALAAHQAQLHSTLQQAYDELRRTQQAALQEERLRALGQMASGIAHDINNAISPVALYTESLLESEPNLSTRTRSYLETIRRAIDDVAETIGRMREFYRKREADFDPVPVHVNPLIEQIVELTRARWRDMPQRGGYVIDMVMDLAHQPPPILGIASEMREALTNLIFNAVDAMPEGGTLTIRTKVTTNPGHATTRHLQIEVSDTGVGMDEETQRRCMEPFFTTKGERGTGLGLAMVYGALQRHGAQVEIESAIGVGTTIRLVFEVPAIAAQLAPPATPSATSVRQLRILLVDDDPLLLESMSSILSAEGHRIVAAEGGQSGIEAFQQARWSADPCDVVITDLGMPHVDGHKVAAAIKQASPSTPVILVTGWGQRLAAEDHTLPHVDCVLGKPPKIALLREALAKWCAGEPVAALDEERGT